MRLAVAVVFLALATLVAAASVYLLATAHCAPTDSFCVPYYRRDGGIFGLLVAAACLVVSAVLGLGGGERSADHDTRR